jgi:hypothetical protein
VHVVPDQRPDSKFCAAFDVAFLEVLPFRDLNLT